MLIPFSYLASIFFICHIYRLFNPPRYLGLGFGNKELGGGCHRYLSPNPQVLGGKYKVHGDILNLIREKFTIQNIINIHISSNNSFKEVTQESKEMDFYVNVFMGPGELLRIYKRC